MFCSTFCLFFNGGAFCDGVGLYHFSLSIYIYRTAVACHVSMMSKVEDSIIENMFLHDTSESIGQLCVQVIARRTVKRECCDRISPRGCCHFGQSGLGAAVDLRLAYNARGVWSKVQLMEQPLFSQKDYYCSVLGPWGLKCVASKPESSAWVTRPGAAKETCRVLLLPRNPRNINARIVRKTFVHLRVRATPHPPARSHAPAR